MRAVGEGSEIIANSAIGSELDLLGPLGKSFTLEFMAPRQTGDYPYICTFPGHWRIMQGMMKVAE